MAKKQKTVSLELVPAKDLANGGMTSALITTEIPKGVKKLTLPPLLKPEQIPVGSMVSGKIIGLVNSISGREDMRESKLIHLQNGEIEFLLPLTGTIKKAIGGNEGVVNNAGKMLFVKRQMDGETEKYGGLKKVYMFDVYLG